MTAPKAPPPPPSDFDRRPRRIQGDPTPTPIFTAVGVALTIWETLDGELGDLFDALTPTQKRIAHNWYANTESSSARFNMIRQQSRLHLHKNKDILADIEALINDCQNLAARRNELAHGRIYGMGEQGFILGPSTVKRSNFPDRVAKFQYNSEDVRHYIDMFKVAQTRLHGIMRRLKREYDENVVLCQFQDP